MTSTHADDLVIVLHGLHHSPIFVQPLVKLLKQHHYRTYAHRYYSLKDDITTHSASLHQHLLATCHTNTRLHIVAHSLGGLVARHFAATYPQWHIDKIVTLGTPHAGSVCANYAKRYTAPLIGNAYLGALDGTCPPLPDGIKLGVIAGNKPLGIGRLFLAHYSHSQRLVGDNKANDGTVYVHETYLPNACDHLVIESTHTGLIYHPRAHQQLLYFLQHGQFLR